MLDGIELYKAVHHSRGHKSGSHVHSEEEDQLQLPPGVPPSTHLKQSASGVSDPAAMALGSEDRGAIGESFFLKGKMAHLFKHVILLFCSFR